MSKKIYEIDGITFEITAEDKKIYSVGQSPFLTVLVTAKLPFGGRIGYYQQIDDDDVIKMDIMNAMSNGEMSLEFINSPCWDEPTIKLTYTYILDTNKITKSIDLFPNGKYDNKKNIAEYRARAYVNMLKELETLRVENAELRAKLQV